MCTRVRRCRTDLDCSLYMPAAFASAHIFMSTSIASLNQNTVDYVHAGDIDEMVRHYAPDCVLTGALNLRPDMGTTLRGVRICGRDKVSHIAACNFLFQTNLHAS